MAQAGYTTRAPLGATLGLAIPRALVVPTALAHVGLTLALLTKEILLWSGLVVNHGLGLGAVLSIALAQSVPVAARTLPFAVLVGCAVALGRQAADRELVALEACGVSRRALLVPVLGFAAALALLDLAALGYAAPWASRHLDVALARATRDAPGILVEPGAMLRFGDARLEVREASASGERLRGVFVWLPALGHGVFAESGTLTRRDGEPPVLELAKGEIWLSGRSGARRVQYEALRVELPDPLAPALREVEDPLARIALPALAEAGRQLFDGDGAARAQAELHRRLSLAASTPLFAMLAVLATRRRGSRAQGALTALLAMVAYYALFQLGVGLGEAHLLPPALSAWLCDVALAAVCVGLFAVHGGAEPWRRASGRVGSARRAARVPRSHSLDGYVARQFLLTSAAAFGLLLVGYLVIDALERLDWLARHGATTAEALHFYAARLPLLASRVAPMALLAGAALAVGRLAVERELLAMTSCGISAARGLLPIALLAALAAPLHHVWNDAVLPRSNALADDIKEREIKDRIAREGPSDLLYRSGDEVFRVLHLDPVRGEAGPITVWQLGATGLPTARTDARGARLASGGRWELEAPVRVEAVGRGLAVVPAPAEVDLGAKPAEWVDPMHLSLAELARFIRDSEAGGYDATRFRVDWQRKLAAPAACLLLPCAVLALALALGGSALARPARLLLASAGLAVAWVLVSGVGASLGYAETLPPLVAGWSAPLLVAGFAASLVALRRA
jgi:lipopolysaccharide export system permease protein